MSFLLRSVGPRGRSGFSGYSGYSGQSAQAIGSGYSGFSGSKGQSGFSGLSGAGTSGYSGFSGVSTSGFSGYSGFSSASGFSGYSGKSGYSSQSGYSGLSGFSGISGFSGTGSSGYSGYSGSAAPAITNITQITTRRFSDLQLIPIEGQSVVYVDSTIGVGNDATAIRGRPDLPFATLQPAHNATIDGDRIVAYGTFSPSTLTISKNRLTIDAYGVKLIGTIINITGSDVTINGLEIDGQGSPIRTLNDVVLNSSTTIRSTTGAFTNADVGKWVTFRNQKNAYSGNSIASIFNSETAVLSYGIGATKTGVNMEIWDGDSNQGLIEITGPRCHLNGLYLHDWRSHLIRPGAGCDGLRIVNCRLDNGSNGVSGANYSANPIYDIEITGCTANRNRYDSYRLSTEGYTGSGAAYRGCKINVNTSREACTFGVELYGAEAACADCSVDGNYIANSGLGGISMAATNHSSASNNHIKGYFGTGIEWAENNLVDGNSAYNTCNNNIIDRSNEDGSYQDPWASGTSGLSISSNSTLFNIKLKIQGNTIIVPDGFGINSRQVYGIYCDGNYTHTGLSAYSFGSPVSDIEVKNAYGELLSASSYGIWVDTTGQNSTGFHYINNRFVRLDGTDGYALYTFYSGDGPHTVNDVIVQGTRTNMTHGGSGFVFDGGNILNMEQVDNLPQTTVWGNGQFGFVDIQRWYQGFFTDCLVVGDGHPESATSSPGFINLGASYSNTAGQNLKLILWKNGSTVYGIGISSHQMDFVVPDAAGYAFFINTEKVISIDTAGALQLLKHIPDSSGPNDSIYYSTTQGDLCYKSPSGTVRPIGLGSSGYSGYSGATGASGFSGATPNSFTSPSITTSINDSNGNEIIHLSPAASAVNTIAIANSGTGTPSTVQISARGNDSDINIRLLPKGTGNLLVINGITPFHMSDSSAGNDTIYYSTTQSKLVYKDSGGTVNVLY